MNGSPKRELATRVGDVPICGNPADTVGRKRTVEPKCNWGAVRLFVSGLVRLDFYLIDLPDVICLNVVETVAVKMRRDNCRNKDETRQFDMKSEQVRELP